MKIYDNVKVEPSIVPAVYTADSNGAGVDTKGYDDAMIIVNAGDIDLASADETYVIELEESDDNSTFTDVSGVSVTITADDTVGVARVSELNVVRKRYLRLVLNVGGTTPSFPGGAMIALGEPASAPVN